MGVMLKLIVAVLVFGGLAARGAPTAATRAATRPASQAAGKPAAGKAAATQELLTPAQEKRQKVQLLTRKSLELFKEKKFKEVEAVLVEALVLDPEHTTNVYNMACVKSVTGQVEDAVAYLERAALAGFTDFIHIQQDADLAPLRGHPRYKALIAAKDFYQKRDADRNVASLRQQLGDKYLFDVDAEHKLIFAAQTDAETLTAVKKWLSAQAKSQQQQLFAHKPDQYVAVVLPSLADYRKIIRQPGVEGIYMHGSRMLIARRLGQVMTHEFTHALHAADLDALGQEHPIWVVEGIASLFEAGQFDGEKLVPRDNYRLSFLQLSQRQKRLIPLEKLITWKQSQFVANANLGYGQASSVMLYLYEKGLLRAFYDGFKADFAKDPSGKLTLERVMGKPIAQVDKDWQQWMMKRQPPVMAIGVDGPYLGVRFEQENDGLRIDEVVAQGPAARAGVKVGDVVVGVNELDVRDQQSLMPLLKEFKAGDSVVFKLRRGEEYIDLPLKLGRVERKGATTRPAGK